MNEVVGGFGEWGDYVFVYVVFVEELGVGEDSGCGGVGCGCGGFEVVVVLMYVVVGCDGYVFGDEVGLLVVMKGDVKWFGFIGGVVDEYFVVWSERCGVIVEFVLGKSDVVGIGGDGSKVVGGVEEGVVLDEDVGCVGDGEWGVVD